MSWAKVGWLAIVLCTPAWAEDQPAAVHVAVEVTEPGALQIDAALLRRLLELELDAQVSVGSAGESAPSVSIRLAPGASADSVNATLHWCDSAPSVAESVALPTADPQGRARALALVLGELNRSRPNPEPPGAQVVRVPQVPKTPTVRRRDPAQSSTSPPTRLFSGAVGPRSYLSLGTALLRAQGGVRLPLTREPRVSLRIEPGLEFGQFEDPLNRAQLFSAGFAAGVEVETGGDSLRLAVGPQLELGWLFITGAPPTPASLGARRNGFGLNAVVAVALRAPVYRAVQLQVEFEFGYGVSSVVARGDDRPIASTTGPLLGLSVGLLFPSP